MPMSTHVGTNIPHEVGRKSLAKRGDDDHESLEPHADIHHQAQDEHQRNAGSNRLEPEELRRDDVATHHDEVRPPVLAEGSVQECKLLVERTGIPRDEELHRVGVAHH